MTDAKKPECPFCGDARGIEHPSPCVCQKPDVTDKPSKDNKRSEDVMPDAHPREIRIGWPDGETAEVCDELGWREGDGSEWFVPKSAYDALKSELVSLQNTFRMLAESSMFGDDVETKIKKLTSESLDLQAERDVLAKRVAEMKIKDFDREELLNAYKANDKETGPMIARLMSLARQDELAKAKTEIESLKQWYTNEQCKHQAEIERMTIAFQVATVDLVNAEARIKELEAESEVNLLNQDDFWMKREQLLVSALQNVLNEGNMAAQGHWDATDKMKNTAYEALKELERTLD